VKGTQFTHPCRVRRKASTSCSRSAATALVGLQPSRLATLQVKYSRAYEKPPNAQFKFGIWFRNFPVSEQADFFILAALYPNVTGRGGGKKTSWWLPLILVLSRAEMAEFIASLRTRSGGVDSMFYFGFDTPERVLQTRGAPGQRDFTAFTLANRLPKLRQHLGVATA
jgi:hypothetical protein